MSSCDSAGKEVKEPLLLDSDEEEDDLLLLFSYHRLSLRLPPPYPSGLGIEK